MKIRQEVSAFHLTLAEKFFSAQIIAGITAVIVAFLFAAPVFSQEEPAADEPVAEKPAAQAEEATQSTATEAAEGVEEPAAVIDEEAAETEAAVEADAAVTTEDLGVSEAKILPDSPLYGLKRFGRKFRELITINPVKKAEVRLKHASQELADAEQLLEKAPEDSDAIATVVSSVEAYTATVQDMRENVADVAEKVQEGDGNAEGLLDDVLDKQIKHQKVFQKIEDHLLDQVSQGLPEDVLEKIRHAKEESHTAAGEIMVAIEADPTKLAERMDKVFERQAGSQFKDLRNVEVLKDLEDFVPDQAKDAIRQAEENAFKRFSAQLENIHPEKRGARFESYVRKFDGDRTRQMEIFDDLKQFRGTPTEVLDKIEAAKDIAAKRFQEEIESLETEVQDPELREKIRAHMLASFEQHEPDVKKLRAVEEIQKRAVIKSEEVKAEIKKHQEAGIEKFKASFPDSNSQEEVARFQELSRQMAENPDPTTFRLLQELEEKVKADPKKREFIESMEREAKAKFLERAQKDGEEFFSQIASTNPDDIEIFKKLQEEFTSNPESFVHQGPPGFPPGMGPEGFGPPGMVGGPDGFGPPPAAFRKFFEQAIQKQTDTLTSHVEQLENPEDFVQFQEKFQSLPPEIAEEIAKQKRDFGQIFNDKRRFILEKSVIQDESALRERFSGDEAGFEAERQRLFEERFQAPDIFCDAACQEREKAHIEGFRGQFIGGPQDGQGFNQEIMMQKFGSDPAMRQNIERMMQQQPQGGFMPPQGQSPEFRGPRQMPRKPEAPKPFVDEAGIPIPDHKIEEVKARMRAQKPQKSPEEQQPFFRDGEISEGVKEIEFTPPEFPRDGQAPGGSFQPQFPPQDFSPDRFSPQPSDFKPESFGPPQGEFGPPGSGSFPQPQFHGESFPSFPSGDSAGGFSPPSGGAGEFQGGGGSGFVAPPQ